MGKLGPKLGRFPDKLADEVEDRLRKLGDDMVTDAQRAMMKSGPPGRSRSKTGSHNSRRQAAAGITSTVRGTKMSFTSDRSRMAAGRAPFPAMWGMTKWSHPVFGNRAVKVQQSGGGGSLGPIMRAYNGKAEREFEKAGQDALDKL